MKVTVKSVADTSFDGRDGTKVAAAKLTFEVDGQTKSLDTYIPPVVTAALAWKPGEEVEIEEYADKNGKPRFKTPQAGRGGGGFKQRSVEEQLVLDRFQDERVDRRRSLEQAIVVHDHSVDPELILDTAGLFYKWLRKTASEPHSSPPGGAEARRGSDTGAPAAVDQPAGAPPSSGDKPEAAEGLGEGEAPGPKAAHIHTFTDEPFEYDGQAIPVRKGWEVCTGCLNGRRKAA
jgi:hypothetical protein